MSGLEKIDASGLKDAINKLANDIKVKVDIVDHICKHENLTKSGDNWAGPHSKHSSEDSNSNAFVISTKTGLFNCFACDSGGDIISYESERLSVGNFEAMKSLAEQYSVELPDLNSYNNLSEEEKLAFEEKSKQIALIQNIQSEFSKFCIENLNSVALKYLKDRGLTEETIEKYQLGYCPKDCTKFSTKFKVKDLISSGLFQLYDNGNLVPVLGQRIILPHLKNGHPVYFTGRALHKQEKLTYKAQKTSENINEYAVERISIQCGSFQEKSPSGRSYKKILITEGCFDCLLAAQEFGEEYVVLSNNTVAMSEKQFDYLARGISNTPKREIVFCYDNDSNNSGQNASFKSSKKLEQYILESIIRRWGSENNKNEQEIESAIRNKSIPADISDFMPKVGLSILRRSPEVKSVDIADQIKNDRRKEVYRWISSPLTIREYEAYLDNENKRFNTGPRGGFSPLAMANEIEREGRFYLNVRSEIEVKSTGLLYRYKNGQYVPDSNQLEKIIHEKNPEILTKNVSEVLTKIKQLNPASMTDLLPDLHQTNINIGNGWVDFDKEISDKEFLQPHDPYKHSIIQLNVNYDPSKQCKLISKFLSDILPEHDIHEILKWMAYSIIPGNSHQQALMCPGAGSNGKSTLFSIWQHLIGRKNYSTRSLHDLEEKQFATYDLYGSLVNFGSEISSRAIAKKDGMFKAITGEDDISIEPKHQNTFQMIALCILVFSANKLPFLNDRTYGNLRRWVYIPFDQTIKGENVDKNLKEKLITEDEISGLFNVLIQSWKLLKIQGDFIPSERGQEVKQEHISDSDRILGFCEDFVTFDPESKCLTAEIYKAYELYEQVYHGGSTGSYKLSKIAFNRELKRIADTQDADFVTKKSDHKNKGWQTWIGIKLDQEMVETLIEESQYELGDEPEIGFGDDIPL